MDFFSFPLVQLTVAQFTYLIFLYFLFASLVMIFFDKIVNFICRIIRGIFNRDKNGQ